ncbi:MAG TPA: AI-2E family transporter [Asanoa sp.]
MSALANGPHRRPASDRLRSVGNAAWSLVGIALLFLAVAVLVMALRSIILAIVIAVFLAIVFSPLVDASARRGLPRAAGAAMATLAVVAVGAVATALVLGGVLSQQQEIGASLDAAVTRMQDILTSAGMSGTAAGSAEDSVRGSTDTVMLGLAPAIGNLFGTVVNAAIGVFVALFTCFFLLKDGHSIAARVSGWIPLPGRSGAQLLDQAATTIRRYFVGLTVLGVFNAAVVVVGALILDVPLVGTIAVITLLGSYVPYVGALVAGAFAVLIALGSGGTSSALWMLLVVFLANGLLQNLVSPFAYGAALEVSPLVLLLTALLGAALAGVVGLALAAPITAIVVHSARLLRRSRRPEGADDVSDPPAAAVAPLVPDGDPA